MGALGGWVVRRRKEGKVRSTGKLVNASKRLRGPWPGGGRLVDGRRRDQPSQAGVAGGEVQREADQSSSSQVSTPTTSQQHTD